MLTGLTAKTWGLHPSAFVAIDTRSTSLIILAADKFTAALQAKNANARCLITFPFVSTHQQG
jgi:hypothetical protein